MVSTKLENKTSEPVRLTVKVRAPEPNTECEMGFFLGPGKDTLVACPQQSIVADAEYTLSIAVFGDSAATEPVESGSASARFGKKEVKAHNEWIQANALPKSFEHVEMVNKVTAGTTLSSMFGAPKGDGTLSGDFSGVTYRTKKETIVIPSSQIRSVELNRADPKQPWVVVEYREGGASKVVSFKPNVYRGDASADRIAVAIRSAMEAPSGR